MAWIRCQFCKQEGDKDSAVWWTCDVCGYRVCTVCVHRHTGDYGSGQKCSQCQTGQMRKD